MAGYIITYTEQKDFDHYETMVDEIKKCKTWWKYSESTWLVVTHESAEELWKRFKDKIDKEKLFLIIGVDGDNRQGWLKKDHWMWIDSNLKKGGTDA